MNPVRTPGVYVDEIPSAGSVSQAATARTAFVGPTPRGPAAGVAAIDNFASFVVLFGDLTLTSPLSFAVRDFFQMGGETAVVVRVCADDARRSSAGAWAAESPGAWGNGLAVTVSAARSGEAGRVDVLIRDEGTNTTERFDDVNATEGPDSVSSTLRLRSALARFEGPDAALATGTFALSGGSDGSVPGPPALLAALLDRLPERDVDAAFNLLCVPPPAFGQDLDAEVIQTAIALAEARGAFVILDPPATWTTVEAAIQGARAIRSPNAALYFPRLRQPNPLRNGADDLFAPCGAVAGIFASVDRTRGVWQAPAGTGAVLQGSAPELDIGESQAGQLNAAGINPIRRFGSLGTVIWGARTRTEDETWRYIHVRRLALFIEASLRQSLKWTVFEPNGPMLWERVTAEVDAFLQQLFLLGAFAGTTAKEAYSVRCDSTTTSPEDQAAGMLNVLVAFAPDQPAEFVLLELQCQTA